MKATLKGLKEHNIGLIIKAIRETSDISRVKISEDTKLARSTVSDLANILIDYKVIKEDKKLESGLGKKPIKLKFNENFKYILAINIELDNLKIILTNLNGEPINRIEINRLLGDSRKDILQIIFNLIDKILQQKKSILEKILVISIGSHGVVNPSNNIISNAPYLKEWSGINLVNIFNKRYKKNVIINNSINLGAIGEQWINYPMKKDLIYLNIDHGVGAGIIVNNKILKGVSGATGEISYLPVLLENNYSRLEENKFELGFYEKQIDVNGILQLVNDNVKSYANVDFQNLSYGAVCSFYKDLNNNPIKNIINDVLVKKIAIGISCILTTIDTELLILNGEILKLGDDFLNKIRNEVSRIIPFEKNIVASQLKEDAHIYGAIKEGINYVNNILYNKFYSLVK